MALNPQFAAGIRTVRVDFGFSMFDCDPEDITAALGVVPDEIRRRDEERQMPGGRLFRVPFSSWRVSSKQASKDVNDHCRELLERLRGCASRLDPRWGVPTFGVLYKATHLSSGNGPFFEADVVRGIASFGAELWQDIYALDEDVPDGDAETS